MRVLFRVVPWKDSPTCDVEAAEEGGKPRVVNTFNREADAWQWVREQEHVVEICTRIQKGAQDKR